MKFFTIIIPLYNPTKLKRALDSIESQSCKNDIEVILVNDAGSREFESLLPLYSFNYKVIHNEINVGPGLARQVGIDNSDGLWITFLDHDDEFNPDCFKYVKEDIINSECEFIYSTQSIIANNYEWIQTEQYIVEDSGCVLHGHFYNREKLKYYNIHFNEKLRAHEDTYFLSLVSGHLAMDKDNLHLGKSEVKSPIITYYWYLWSDSTCHSFVNHKQGKISYLEATIKEYVIALFDAYKEITAKYPYDPDYTYIRLCSMLLYLYWFIQAFKYQNQNSWKTENLKYVKEARDMVMNEFNMQNVTDLTNILLDLPDLYSLTYKAVLTNIDGAFVPRQTIEQFFQDL